jgi:hypothetical protein
MTGFWIFGAALAALALVLLLRPLLFFGQRREGQAR